MADHSKDPSRNNYDFCGWATKNDIRCSDGRIIRQNAFKEQDGQVVPLVYMHNHNDAEQVLGHCMLENRPEGVYMYGLFNNSPKGKAAKESVIHKDIRELSIWANKLKEKAGEVFHGMIQEVSLVLRGANTGAKIEDVIAHSADGCGIIFEPVLYQELEDENGDSYCLVHTDTGDVLENNAIITYIDKDGLILEHAEEEPKTETQKEAFERIMKSLSDDDQNVVYAVIGTFKGLAENLNPTEVAHSDATRNKENLEAAFERIMASLNNDDQELMWAIIGNAAKNKEKTGEKMAHSDEHNDVAEIREVYQSILDELPEEDASVIDTVVGYAFGQEPENGQIEHADKDFDYEEKFTKAMSKLSEDKQDFIESLIAIGAGDEEDETNNQNEEITHSEGDNDMSYKNVFEGSETENVLSHAERIGFLDEAVQTIMRDKTSGKFVDTLREMVGDGKHEAILKHCFGDDGVNSETYLSHGIDGIDKLFPDAKELYPTPETVNNPDDWTAKVLGAVNRTPFTRFKTTFATIEYDTARAKGYITGNMKKEQWQEIRKRSVTPGTVYAKEHLDKDYIDDIKSFDVVAWVKSQMMVKLKEELARAILIGDGRDVDDEDKIDPKCIVPIYGDVEPFVIYKTLTVSDTITDDQEARNFIKAVTKSHDDYRGKRTPVLFAPKGIITKCLLIEDTLGRFVYSTVKELCDRMRVSEIVEVYEMGNVNRQVSGKTRMLKGIMTNLNEAYTLGTQKGGEIESFNFFDIDFNKWKYLDETRCSGMLTKWNNAVVFEAVYGLVCTITPTAGTTTRYGKLVSTLQSNVFVHDDFITGELNYIKGPWTEAGFTEDGYYVALDIDVPDGATVKCLNEATETEANCTTDGYLVARVPFSTNNWAKKHLVFTVTKTGEPTLVLKYRLSGLRPAQE